MASATERMIAYHIARLDDKNSEVRLKAIHELDLLNAVQALDDLEALYRRESDPDVKAAARALGRKLFRLKKAQGD